MGSGHYLVLSCVEVVISTEPRTDAEGTAKVPAYEDSLFFFFLNPP